MGFGKDGKGAIIRETVIVTPGALAAGAAILGTAGVTLDTTSFRILKTDYFVSQRTAWQADGDEIYIGLANGTLSVTEIAETMGNDGPVDRNESVAAAIAERAVWPLLDLKDLPPSGASFSEPSNNGQKMSFNPKWTFTPTEGWSWFAFNPLSAALTTGAVFVIHATHYGVWVD